RRDQVADDDVLLQPDQVVPGAPHGRIRQDAGRLLERGGADERLRGQAGLGDPQQQRLGPGRRAAPGDHLLVGLPELQPVDVLALQVLRVPGVRDPDLLQHLAHDDADVLVVDLDALEPVDLLDLVEQVLLHGPPPLDPPDVVRVDRTLAQAVARTDLVALVDPQVLADRDLVHALRALRRHHDDLALAALDLAEPDGAVDLRDDRRVLGPPSFEQLGHPRQTARNVAGLVDLPADLGQRGPGLDDVAVAHGELRADRDDELPQLLVPVERADLDHRVELLLPVLDDHELATTGGLVELLADGLLLD